MARRRREPLSPERLQAWVAAYGAAADRVIGLTRENKVPLGIAAGLGALYLLGGPRRVVRQQTGWAEATVEVEEEQPEVRPQVRYEVRQTGTRTVVLQNGAIIEEPIIEEVAVGIADVPTGGTVKVTRLETRRVPVVEEVELPSFGERVGYGAFNLAFGLTKGVARPLQEVGHSAFGAVGQGVQDFLHLVTFHGPEQPDRSALQNVVGGSDARFFGIPLFLGKKPGPG